MIHPALLMLIRLRIGASFRQMWRSLKRPRGALLFAFGLAMICGWIASVLVAGLSGQYQHLRVAAPHILPLALMAFSVLIVVQTSGESAICFSPSEIDFLFCGPFSRRELLVFKLATSLLMTLFSALFVSIFFVSAGGQWVAFYVGTVLTFMLLQLLTTSVALIRQTISEHIYTRTRRLIGMLVLLLIAIGIFQVLLVGMQRDWLQLVREFRVSGAGIVLLAPFEVFSRSILAERIYPDLLLWGGISLAIDLALLALVIRLDANYLETAVAVSQKLYGLRERIKRGGNVFMLVPSHAPRWSVPQFPWMGGAGPIAWQQLTTAARSSRSLLVFSFLTFAFSIAAMAMMERHVSASTAAPVAGITIIGYMSFLFAMMHFPHDVEHIDWLKSLPLRSMAIACGELSGVVLLWTLLQVLFFCLTAIWLKESALVLLVAAVFAPPFNLVLFAVGNLVFLVYPTRMILDTLSQFQHMARQMIFMLLKAILLMVCCGTAAGFGTVAFFLTGRCWITFAAVSWVALVLEVVGLVCLVAWAFRRFDPSIDKPA